MKNEHTGPLREYWNMFKRGMSEINFLLNIIQTVLMIWAAKKMTGGGESFSVFAISFILAVGTAATLLGRYSIKKVDTALTFLNPFAQDIVVFRHYLATALEYASEGNNMTAKIWFRKAQEKTEKWMVEE